MEKLQKLTGAQARVMAYLAHGWHARVSHGSAIEVNGKRICNVDTMMALSRIGLAQKRADGQWEATDSGKALAQRPAL